MEVARFCSTSHVVIVAGKGGVGKTTVTAALAVAAARAGRSVMIVEVEGKSGLTAMFEHAAARLRGTGARSGDSGAIPHPGRGADRLSGHARDAPYLQAARGIGCARRGRHGGAGNEGDPRAREGEVARGDTARPISSSSTLPRPGTRSPSCSRHEASSTRSGSGRSASRQPTSSSSSPIRRGAR